MKKRSTKLKSSIALLFRGRTRYVTVSVLAVLLVGGSALAYHNNTQSNSMQQQVTDTGEADEVQNSPETAGGTEGDSSDTTQPSDNNSQPTQSAPRQASAAPTPSKAGCNWYSDVPYNTVNTPDSSMHEGQTKTVGGVNGSRKVCTDAKGNVISNEVTYPAVDMVVYYGTYTRDQALSDSRAACRSKGLYEGSTDFSDCVSSEMRKRGF